MDDEELMPLKRGTIKTMFDIICCSLDWGSGFLDTDEVITLRDVAVLLDVDPMEATPANMRPSFQHDFTPPVYKPLGGGFTDEYKQRDRKIWDERYADKCDWCNKLAEEPPHSQRTMASEGNE